MKNYKKLNVYVLLFMIFGTIGCRPSSSEDRDNEEITLITLDPGHFHAALVQKNSLDGVDSSVFVYAPEGKEVEAHLALIQSFNERGENPTHWNEVVYTGNDFFEKMLEDEKGQVVVLAGNNKNKTEYIGKSIDAGLSVLSDKPMAIHYREFESLKNAFHKATEEGLQLYDIMTERYNIFSILQKELIHNTEIFGEIVSGSPEDPSVIKKSVHHFYKEVSGNPLIRPEWYYDVAQQGEGIVDVTTHYIDLIHWQCFPEQSVHYDKDIEIIGAERWPTPISPQQYEKSTGAKSIPEYLKKDLKGDHLDIYANGKILYSVNDLYAEVEVRWDYEAEEGNGDTHFSLIKGTKSTVTIRQDKEQAFQPKLYIEPAKGASFASDEVQAIRNSFKTMVDKYPGISLEESPFGLEVVIPDDLKEGHEEHFTRVAHQFFEYVREGNMPQWEIDNMISKYYITTKALEIAENK